MKEKETLYIIDFINKASKNYVKFKIILNKENKIKTLSYTA